MTDPFVGKLTFFRVYSGTLGAGSYVYNANADRRERITRILRMHANEREEIKAVYPGDIAAAVGLKKTTTGDTLCDQDHPVILESMVFPEPVVSVAIEPKTRDDEEKLSSALHKLSEEDPTFKVRFDPGDGADDHPRDGGAAPGGPGGADVAGVQRGGKRRETRGCLPRNHPGQRRRRRGSSSSRPAVTGLTVTW